MQLNNDEKKYKVRRDNNCGIIFIISLVSIIILCSILIISLIKQHFFPYDFPGTIDSWINASASITGGALAFGGVWWTIKDQNKKRKEDQEKRDKEKKEELAIQYKPMLTVEKLDYKNFHKLNDVDIDKLSDTSNYHNYFIIPLILNNIGRGEAINVQYIECENVYIQNCTSNIITHLLPKGGHILMVVKVENVDTDDFDFKLILKYTDLYHYLEHETIINISFSLLNKRLTKLMTEISVDAKLYEKEAKL